MDQSATSRFDDAMAKFSVPPSSTLLAAVSGGSDSTALLSLLAPWCSAHGVSLEVVHFNHGLRGEASDGDERFVASLCARLGLKFHSGRPDRPLNEMRGSVEQVARGARYAFFTGVARERGAFAICLGHNRDDVAETLLLRLLRGGGATGLSGLRPRRTVVAPDSMPLTLLRPLLGFSHAELRELLSAAGETWREDATNADTAIPRNAVRAKVLPALDAECGGDARAVLARTAEILRADDEFLDILAHEAFAGLRVDAGGHGVRAKNGAPFFCGDSVASFALRASALAAKPLALRRRVIRLALQAWGVESGFDVVERIDNGINHGEFAVTVDGGFGIKLTEDGMLWCQRPRGTGSVPVSDDKSPVTALAIPGETVWRDCTIRATYAEGIIRDESGIGELPARASLSRAAVERGGGLEVRAWMHGDRIDALGLAGSKKLQDVFTDAHVPSWTRDLVPVICCGDEIAWVPGYRIAKRFALADGQEPAIQLSIDAI